MISRRKLILGGSAGIFAPAIVTRSRTISVNSPPSGTPSNFVNIPGSSASVFNVKLTAGGSTYSGTTPFSTYPSGFMSGNSAGKSDQGYPVWVAQASDPLVNVLFCISAYNQQAYNGGPWAPTGNGTTIDNQIRAASTNAFPVGTARYTYSTNSTAGSGWTIPSGVSVVANPSNGSALQVRCPTGVIPCPDSDGHMAVYQPNGTMIETYASFILADGTIACSNMNVNSTNSRMDGFQGGMTATMIPNYAGLIRQYDVTSGTIAHAMTIVVPGTTLVANTVTYPAITFDRNSSGYAGTLPQGTRYGLPFSINVNTVRSWSTTQGLMLAVAAQNYGFITCDRGGGGVTVKCAYGMTDTNYNGHVNNGLASDLAFIMQHVQVVTNPPS